MPRLERWPRFRWWIGTIKWILSNSVPLGTSHSAWISSVPSIHGLRLLNTEMTLFLGSRLEGAHFIQGAMGSSDGEFYAQDIKKGKCLKNMKSSLRTYHQL